MSGKKKIKDPIYGYIEIDDVLFETIIDTPEFQRLKDVIQTSYSSLYPSTLHNRFVHSLGVYKLGCMASEAVLHNCDQCNPDKEIIKKYKKIFELSCLLHDVGHAPFSHTGEEFYLENGDRASLHEELTDISRDDTLKKEIQDKGYKAAPHEIMSAIIGIKTYGGIIGEEYYGFFARCITGYKYGQEEDNAGILNCYIEMLNSKILDVDKIDYLIRDSYMSGFDSSSIDYERLFKEISIRSENNNYMVCYGKAALSVVENVVYAHDLERKWIQSHPTVLYEAYLVKKVFEEIIGQQFSEFKYLPSKILTQEGLGIKGYGKVRLASDSDMLYLMKNLKNASQTTEEYFDRRKRKHPIWKTESEFQAIFKTQNDVMISLQSALKELGSSQRTGGIVLNDEILKSLNEDINNCEKMAKEELDSETKNEYLASIKKKKNQKQLVEIFKTFSENHSVKFDYLILYTNQFNSGFKKPEFENMMFDLPAIKGQCRFGEISNLLRQHDSKGDEYFYIYYTKDKEVDMSIFSKLIEELMNFAGRLWTEDNAKTISSRMNQTAR